MNAKTVVEEVWSILGPRLTATAPHDPLFQAVVTRVNRESKTLQQFFHLLFTKVVKVFDRLHYLKALS